MNTSPVTNEPATALDPTTPEVTNPVVDGTTPSTPSDSDGTVTTTPPTAPVVSAPVTAPPATDTSAEGQAITLTRQDGPIVAHDGDVIKNLDIYVDSGVALTIDGSNVTVQDVRIHYNGAGGTAEGMGIQVNGANDTIKNVEIFNAGAPASGAEVNPEHYGIEAMDAQGLTITNATIHDASTGIYLLNSPGATLQGIEGYDMRGPEPRGQLVQLDKSANSTLTDFYVHNDATKAFTEDNISVYQSDNVTISNGVIDGNNSPSGQGVIFEESNNGLVSHVDAVHMGNGAFASFGNNNTFDFTRSFDNIATDQGRGEAPLSGGVIFTLGGDGNTISNSSYENAAVPDNVVYSDEATNAHVEVAEVTGVAPQAHLTNDFLWA